MTTTGPLPSEERHASWLELFFDLVAVAGIGTLAHLLEGEPRSGDLAVYVIAYTAIWMIWACYTIYGNIAADRVHVNLILAGMFVLGVMIAAVPEIQGEHATAFAIAYVVGRFLAGRPWRRTTVVVDLPVVQTGAGIVPWVVSWWFDGTTQYVLWAVGLGIDLLFVFSANRERLLARIAARIERARGHGDEKPTLEPVSADVPHLAERLGLFVLIVIGEGLVQIIDAASEAEWNRALAITGAGAFALMYGLWGAAVRFGYAGIALLPERGLSARLSWPAHLLATLAIATVAAEIGSLVADPRADVADHVRWVLVTAYAGYAVLSAGVHAAHGDRRRAAYLVVPMGAAAVLVSVAEGLAAEGVVWLLAGGVLVAASTRLRRAPTPTEA